MSNQPDDGPHGQQHGSGNQQGGRNQGGQQPAGQHAGQPRGGQQGSPPGGGRQGGYPQGAPPGGYQRGPGVGDIFSIPETQTEIKVGLVLNLLLSIGFGIAAFGLSTAPAETFGGFIAVATNLGVSTGILALLVIGAPIIGLGVGLRQSGTLEEQTGSILYANAAVTALIGVLILLILSTVFGLLATGESGAIGDSLSNMILPFIIGSIGAGLLAAGAAWTDRNVLPGPSRARTPPQQGQSR